MKKFFTLSCWFHFVPNSQFSQFLLSRIVLKALVSILAAYSFVNMPSTARASTSQLFLMAFGLVVHAAQSVAVFGMMAAAWSRLLERVIIWIRPKMPKKNNISVNIYEWLHLFPAQGSCGFLRCCKPSVS